MVPTEKGGEKKKGCCAVKEGLTREHAISVQKCIRGVGFQKCAPRDLKEVQKLATKKVGKPDACIDPRLNRAVWAQRIRNAPNLIHVRLSRKHEDEDSPNELHTLATCVPVTNFETLRTVNVDEN
ncbi:60S ribosomal protein L31-like [Choloepus didactylus]|uniref:60S ribosomal protein L31-like n=1 Tax=Choloepus didactylus TaxID=27675 RepID=UPI0018A0FFD7|nr:60S ribosomal protein L31-like [Choloepus didactylus]